MNYFVCPSSPPKNSRMVPNQLVPVPFQLETTRITAGKDQQDKSKPIDIKVMPSLIMPEVKGPDMASKEADQDQVSQVFFKKMKENEFVDMKMDSPKSPTTKGFVPPQIDAGKFNFEDTGDALETKISSPRTRMKKKLWKWKSCYCLYHHFGSHQRNNQQQNQKLRFQIFNEDKRIKQVVHHATKFNEAITTVRGVPIARAHITYGGYYDGL
ncbi:hypothetical protein GH714_004924 [Hevea brasiliensis]|uniref:DUF6821 domain-containing protein n=1 Tax=Hevea brasiliensis TaxID=3981 RepID=A0A6A6KID2_HEVBR|nr:hypothetical protein GH714_004924 [Hevea brasiliensis]